MKILILGSEGFIGSHLASFFRGGGEEVFCADIVLKHARDYFLINPEIPDYSLLFQKHNFDVCINATGVANVQLSFSYPSVDFSLNTFNVYNMLEALRKQNPSCRFINLSSAAVYGNPSSLPVTEEERVAPLSPYGYHKWYSELICRQFHSLYQTRTRSVRIFSAYGEGHRKQLFWDVYQKIKSVGTGQPITLYGTGNETRDFIYISDICRAIAKIIQQDDFNGEPINVASGEEIAIRDAVKGLVDALGYHGEVKFGGEEKIGDPKNWRASIAKLKATGFLPSVSFKEGINEVATWMKSLN